MNKDFAEWYREVDIEPDHQRLQSRWKGVENYCSRDITCSDILNLVRLFLNLKISEDFKDNLINAFFESDNAFPQKNNDSELSILAGTILVYISDSDKNQLKIFTLLAIASASFKREIIVPAILTLLRTKLHDSMFANRDVNSIDMIPIINPPIKNLNDSLKAVEASNNWTPPNEIAKQFSKYLSNINKSIADINSALEKSLYLQSIYREDSQILWWLSSEYSKDMHKPISELNNAELCIVLGKELSDIVETLPGPYSAKAVFSKIFSNYPDASTELTILNAVNQTDEKWRKQTLEKYEVGKTGDITPVLAAINESLRVDDKSNAWLTAYKQFTGISAKGKIPIVELTYQIYTECLLLKAYID